jgi:hypothetical protein
MKCPICQAKVFELGSQTNYCGTFVQIAPGYATPHYEYFMSPVRTEVARIPPFIVLRQEDGYLEVKQWASNLDNSKLDTSIDLTIIMQKNSTVSADLLTYYHRFKNLRVFL